MPKKIPLRKCIGCLEGKDKRELLRIVRTSEGDVAIDLTGKKNGRGAYVCKNKICLEKAIKTKGLERSFKEKVSEEVYQSLRTEFDQLSV